MLKRLLIILVLLGDLTNLLRAEDLLLPIQVNSKWGFADQSGRVRIEPAFVAVRGFHEGLAAVETNAGRWGYVDSEGALKIPTLFVQANDFAEGLAPVKSKNGFYGFISKAGDFVLPPVFGEAQPFSEGLAVAKIQDDFAFIDHAGKVAISGTERFDRAQSFSEGLAAVRVNRNWGYLNNAGHLVIPPRYKTAGSFSSGLAPVQSIEGAAKFTFINKSGEPAFLESFELADSFSDSKAAVRESDLWGYINPKGEYIIKPAFNEARPFVDEVAEVVDYATLRTAYIDGTGKYLFLQTLAGPEARFGGLSLVDLRIISKPPGATVYLIPRLQWERDPSIGEDPKRLHETVLGNGPTEKTIQVREEYFYAVFVLGEQHKVEQVNVMVAKPSNEVEADFP